MKTMSKENNNFAFLRNQFFKSLVTSLTGDSECQDTIEQHAQRFSNTDKQQTGAQGLPGQTDLTVSSFFLGK